MLSLFILSSTNSTLPFAKVSLCKNPGYFNNLSISTAVCFSGLTVKDKPKASRMVYICSLYSGFLILAIVCSSGFILCAVMQQSKLISSALVDAIKTSALSTPASDKTDIKAQFPLTAIISYLSKLASNTSPLVSIKIMS